MKDIIEVGPQGLVVIETDLSRAKNILSTQLGSLEYLPEFGIDLEFFVSDEFVFQNETFKAYLITKLTEAGINVAQFTDIIENFFNQYNISVTVPDNTTSFLER